MSHITYCLFFSCLFVVSNATRHSYEIEVISNEEIKTIPTTFSKTINVLEIVNSTIGSLENLSNYKDLKRLIIKNTQIEFINETFYEIENLKKLTALTLYKCSIKVFDLNKLKKFKNLKYMNLGNNPGITFYGSGIWSKLSHLNIARNGLKELPSGLKNLRYLQKLVIDGNLIETLPNYLHKLDKLKYISAKQNPLQNIPKGLEGLIDGLLEPTNIPEYNMFTKVSEET